MAQGSGDVADASFLKKQIEPMLGDTAALVDSVQFEPAAPPAPSAPNGVTDTGGTSAPPSAAPRPPAAPAAPASPTAPAAPAGATPPTPPAPPMPAIVVDVPAILRQTQEQLRDAGVLSGNPEAAKKFDQAIRKSMDMHEASMKAAAAAMAEQHARTAIEAAAAAAPKVVVRLEGRNVAVPVRRNGRMVGHARARLNLDRTLGAILTLARSDQGEVPFAIDRNGQLYTPDDSRRSTLEELGVRQLAADEKPHRAGDWLVVARKDPSGLTFGIARPLGESLRDIRRASVRNLSLGLLVIGLAIIGIVPVSHRMTDRLRALNGGVRQLAAGDFRARVPVRSRDEFGQLAEAFNHMASDLERHQAAAVEQERMRRELELSRQIQMDMLPREPLRFGAAEIKGISVPAREVGGDFFNYFLLPGNRLGLLVGDVSGKGVSAALLMANVQATLRARLPLQPDLAALADLLDRELDASTPGGVFVTAFIAIVESDGRSMRYVNAGHHPQYVLHRDGGLERMSSTGLPIGLFAGHGYAEARVPLAPGDTLFFYTDGLVETENERGELFDHERLEALLTASDDHDIDAVLQRVERGIREFRERAEPLDDATMMVLRV
jgi:serine phosphatase RsbU (regulator of sigma subunit)